MTSADGAAGCGGHAGLAGEARALAVTVLDRLAPVLERVRTEPATAVAGEQPCAVCPVCAVIAALRGERPELAVRLAEQAAGLVSVLRAALDEGNPAPAPASGPPAAEPPPAAPSQRVVQRIPVARPSAP
jgi:hypothetical protein